MGQSSGASSIIMLVALFAIMYFMLIRPQKKKEKQVQQMRDSLQVGDEIVTIGGILGKIVRVKDEEVTIQVGADKTRIDIAKWGVSGKVTEEKVKTEKKPAKTEEEPESGKKKFKRLGKSEESEAAEPVTETAPSEAAAEVPAQEAQAEPEKAAEAPAAKEE